MLKIAFYLSFFLPGTLLSHSFEPIARQIQAHLLIGDATTAAGLAKRSLEDHPEEPLLFEWYIKSLAKLGEDVEMMRIWERYQAHFPEKALNQDLLEHMCWGVLSKGRQEGSINSQLICLVAASLTQDIRALPFLLEGMRSSSALLRAVAVELAALYGDASLQDEIVRLFHEESVLEVRLAVIEALGKLKVEAQLPLMIRRMEDPKTGKKEKLSLIEAIVQMQDCIGKEGIETLAVAKLGLYRQLACEVIAACSLDEKLLLPLMHDPQPEVCAAAIKAWGLLRKPATDHIKRLSQESLDSMVGITAAWVCLTGDPVAGQGCMTKWLESPYASVRALAAGAVKAAGPYGIPLAKKMLEQSDDLYVQLNLAIALAQQREECDRVCTILENALLFCHDQWMLTEKGIFSVIEKSTLNHNSLIPNYPEVINQTVRLELLNLLAILESTKALEVIKAHLKERKWKVNALAAQTLLGEGDEAALALVRELLQDVDPEVRIESALVLAAWGKDASAGQTLLEVYPKSDRQMKLKILESIGRIGNKEMTPFLLACLKEPSLTLRMAAASILIQILNQ